MGAYSIQWRGKETQNSSECGLNGATVQKRAVWLDVVDGLDSLTQIRNSPLPIDENALHRQRMHLNCGRSQ